MSDPVPRGPGAWPWLLLGVTGVVIAAAGAAFSPYPQKAALFGWLLSGVNALGGLAINRRAVGRPVEAFFRWFFLGHGHRAALFVVAFVMIWKWVPGLDRTAFTATAFSGYFAGMIVEIVRLTRNRTDDVGSK